MPISTHKKKHTSVLFFFDSVTRSGAHLSIQTSIRRVFLLAFGVLYVMALFEAWDRTAGVKATLRNCGVFYFERPTQKLYFVWYLHILLAFVM